MFIWWDGKVNPCDVDYKSKLSTGNVENETIKNLWLSSQYQSLREKHLKNMRQTISPRNACTVV